MSSGSGSALALALAFVFLQLTTFLSVLGTLLCTFCALLRVFVRFLHGFACFCVILMFWCSRGDLERTWGTFLCVFAWFCVFSCDFNVLVFSGQRVCPKLVLAMLRVWYCMFLCVLMCF